MTRLALALATVALLGAAPVALAQPGSGGGQGRGGAMMQARMLTALMEGITLSADQRTKVDAVNAAFQTRTDSARREMMAAREAGQAVAPERMQAMRALQTEHRAALRALLTADQQTRFDANVAALPQGRGMGGTGGGRPPRG